MDLFSFGSQADQYGVIIDVGSGSVLTAIVHSSHSKKHPTIIWAHREHAALKAIDSIQQSAKSVMAALIQASMKLDSEGRTTLREYNSKAKLSRIQCGISAPWSYTVTKSINVSQSEPIQVTDQLIEDLLGTAQKQAEEELAQHAGVLPSGLQTISRSTMDILTNGYRVKHPDGELTRSLSLTQATVVAQEYIMDGILEVEQKLFPKTKIESVSFILMMYCTMRSHKPHIDDFCLVDITDEATEIGIVRDGSLTYSTHIPFGLFSLAREISLATDMPLSEALGHLRQPSVVDFKTRLSNKHSEEISTIFTAYKNELSELLNETGDTLSIPKQIFTNIEQSYENLFLDLLESAAKSATKIEHTCTSIHDEMFKKGDFDASHDYIGSMTMDTALLLQAEFFHKQQHCLDFNYS